MNDLFDVVARTGLHFDPASQTGVVFHMISSVTEAGRVGMTAVGDTAAKAQEWYDRAERILLSEARSAATPASCERVMGEADAAKREDRSNGRNFE